MPQRADRGKAVKPDASHIRQIKIVSNTHWDREFRRSFERTRHRLLTMMDVTLGILESDPEYHSFTLDGHAIMVDDYLEMRPEKRPLVEKLVKGGRLVLGPWFTLAEEFTVSHEPLVRNLLWGRKTVEKYGGKAGTVAYTPASWGQTGQLPQILADFGLDKMMFYRGISHHEADAEWIWQAPDGTRVLASRFALYARYNWYYQVHRAVTVGRVFEKDYVWGERDEVPFRIADGLAGEDLAFDLQAPQLTYDKSRLKKAIEDMVEREGAHFTTEVFLAMHGHDISVAHPLESEIVKDARELLGDRYSAHGPGGLLGRGGEAPRQGLPARSGRRAPFISQGGNVDVPVPGDDQRTDVSQAAGLRRDLAARLPRRAPGVARLCARCRREQRLVGHPFSRRKPPNSAHPEARTIQNLRILDSAGTHVGHTINLNELRRMREQRRDLVFRKKPARVGGHHDKSLIVVPVRESDKQVIQTAMTHDVR